MVNYLMAIHGDLQHTFLNRQNNPKNQPSHLISVAQFSVNVRVENELFYYTEHQSSLITPEIQGTEGPSRCFTEQMKLPVLSLHGPVS